MDFKKDPKTSLSGLLTAVATVLPLFGFPIPAEVVTGVQAIGLFFIGLFSKDAKKEG